MKFLLHGNSPTVKTGYGIQIAQLAEQLVSDGHEVACSSTYGIQSSIEKWRGIRVYGCGFDVNSNDRLHMHADHWFDGEPGWIITCVDVWAMKNPLLAEYNVAAWVPIDHATALGAPPAIREFFKLTNALPVTMSRFGSEMLADLDPTYIPLSVDTSVYKPVVDVNGVTPRQLVDVPEDAFVVGMVAMNKGWARDRKGFNEAFRGFAQFAKDHQDAHLVMHSDRWGGAEGIDLVSLAINCGIAERQIHWSGGPNQYAYYVGYPPELMAAVYSAMDVLLAPSHGEGFCVPLIEAQACGTPVIVTDFSAQPELVGAGWKVTGQREWDPPQHAYFMVPHIVAAISDDYFLELDAEAARLKNNKRIRELIAVGRAHNEFGVVDALEAAYEADHMALKWKAVRFAQDFDVQKVYNDYWRPFIARITAEPEPLELDREPMPDENAVAVLCPVLNRPQNLEPLIRSFLDNTPDDGVSVGAADLVIIAEKDDKETMKAFGRWNGTPVKRGKHRYNRVRFLSGDPHTFAEKLNFGYGQTDQPWVLVIGDDVRFHDGWLDQARKLSGEFDVIGTNDAVPPRVKNPKVASGAHADHFFVRRAYVEQYGASLEGPGVLAPEAYKHWYTDMEIVKLAKARGVFSPCPDSIVEHLHPGYDGDEEARQADPTYMAAVEWKPQDEQTFLERLPLIQMQRTGAAKL